MDPPLGWVSRLPLFSPEIPLFFFYDPKHASATSKNHLSPVHKSEPLFFSVERNGILPFPPQAVVLLCDLPNIRSV